MQTAPIKFIVRLQCLTWDIQNSVEDSMKIHPFDQIPGLHIWEIQICSCKESSNNSWGISGNFEKIQVIFIWKCLQKKINIFTAHRSVFSLTNQPTDRQVFLILLSISEKGKRGKDERLNDFILILLLRGS